MTKIIRITEQIKITDPYYGYGFVMIGQELPYYYVDNFSRDKIKDKIFAF